MWKIILLIFFFINLAIARDIIIQGYVKDKHTGVGIDSAFVILINKQNQVLRDTVITTSDGFYSFNLTEVEDKLTPQNFFLSDNYPNPFNPSTRFNLFIPKSGNVTVKVFDVIGKLLEGERFYLSEGTYVIEYSGAGSSAVYFVKVEFENKSFSKKIVQLGSSGNGKLKVWSIHNTNQFRKKSLTQFLLLAEKFAYVSDTVEIDNSQSRFVNFSLETIHSHVTLVDLHNDVLEKVVNGYDIGVLNSINHSDLPRFYKGGVDVQFMALWVNPNQYPNNPFEQTLKMIDSFNVQLNRYNSIFAQARISKEIDSLVKMGKFCAILCVEGGHAIEENLNKLDSLYKLGVRYMTITWNNSLSWATAAADPNSATRGLSGFGRQVIKRMDSLGMIIDVSHVGIKTIDDILETTQNPIIASHSGVRTLRNHYRNLTDQQIIKIAQKGGVIGVIFYPPFLTTASRATIDTVIKHIDYIKNLVGIDYIALGSDFDGIDRTVIGLEDVSKFPNLTNALLKRGYTLTDIRKIYGENFLRVFKIVCK